MIAKIMVRFLFTKFSSFLPSYCICRKSVSLKGFHICIISVHLCITFIALLSYDLFIITYYYSCLVAYYLTFSKYFGAAFQSIGPNGPASTSKQKPMNEIILVQKHSVAISQVNNPKSIVYNIWNGMEYVVELLCWKWREKKNCFFSIDQCIIVIICWTIFRALIFPTHSIYPSTNHLDGVFIYPFHLCLVCQKTKQ